LTTVPGGKLALQEEAQLMPAGKEVICTLPVPDSSTDKVERPPNWAVAEAAALMMTLQAAAVPLQAPPHPLNATPFAGVAVSVTAERAGKAAVQETVGQSIPVGLDVIEPLPDTLTMTGVAKSADTAVYLLTATGHGFG
jgi:hypothetical protein